MVYIVSGFWRSGTSMMMHALKAAGMDVVGEDDPLRMNTTFGREGYLPNPHGFYQFEGDPAAKDFAERYAGKVVKLPWHQAERVLSGNYNVVFMLRDPAEIRRSFDLFLGERAHLIDGGDWGDDFRNYDATVKRIVRSLQCRGSEVTMLEYASVVKSPERHFEILASAGWPIVDISAAASVVNPELHRAK